MNLHRRLLGVPIQKMDQLGRKLSWLRTIYLSIYAVYLYVFMEWLFFLSKPSFLGSLQFAQTVEVLFITAALLCGICLLWVLALWGLSLIPWFSEKWFLFLWAAGLFPAVFFSFTSLLLIDNFTYTIFRFGIVSTSGAARALYGLVFFLLFAGWYRWILRQQIVQNKPGRKDWAFRLQTLLCSAILCGSLVFVGKGLEFSNRSSRLDRAGSDLIRPHILLLGGDGLNAGNLSLYGYERDTTPNLRRLAETSLLIENAFPNAANSAGSITAILTGKLPTQTGVVYNPDILKGADAFQHLPGILRAAGYFTAEIALPYYVDAYALNFQDGFAMVNQQAAYQGHLHELFARLPHQSSGYFLQTIAGRLLDRVLHIFFVREMPDAYAEVTGSQVWSTDEQRLDQLLEILRTADRPVFAHIHLMTTHGAKFQPRRQVFSAGQTEDAEWLADFYDDAILDFDAYVGELWEALSQSGLLDQTVLIVYSDHNMRSLTGQRIPLFFHFPQGELAGRIQNNVQNIDIAPTILDYIGLTVPAWMEGVSLITGEPEPTRPMYSTGVIRTAIDENTKMWAIDPEWLKPPFYQFGFLSSVVCQDSYYLDLTSLRWKMDPVAGHTRPCDAERRPNSKTVLQAAVDRLRLDGFEVGSLEALLVQSESGLEFQGESGGSSARP